MKILICNILALAFVSIISASQILSQDSSPVIQQIQSNQEVNENVCNIKSKDDCQQDKLISTQSDEKAPEKLKKLEIKICNIPDAVFNYILTYLNLTDDIVSCMFASKRFYLIINESFKDYKLNQVIFSFIIQNFPGVGFKFITSTNYDKYELCKIFNNLVVLENKNLSFTHQSPFQTGMKYTILAILHVLFAGPNEQIIADTKCGKIIPFIFASSEGYTEIVSFFIKHNVNVNVNVSDLYKKTPLIYASQQGHRDIVKILIDNNADVNLSDTYRRSPLIFAADRGFQEIVEIFINKNADINVSDAYNCTALIYALKQHGHPKIAKILITYNADINISDQFNIKKHH